MPETNFSIPEMNERDKRIIELIGANQKEKILIIGTGVFPKVEYFLYNQLKCKNIVSGDISQKNLINGKKKLPGVNFVFLDAQKKFNFDNASFDKVILTEVLEHLRNEDITLREIKRVLKKNGKLIISVPKMRWYKIFSPITLVQHKREYNEGKIIKVLTKNGLAIEEMFIGGGIWDLLDLWIHLILKYFLGVLHIDSFFGEKMQKYYKKGFNGKGTDILIRAGKANA